MSERTPCEVFVCINSYGDFAIGTDADAAREAYDSEIGGDGVRRVYAITLHVPTPADILDGGFHTVPDVPEPETVTT